MTIAIASRNNAKRRLSPLVAVVVACARIGRIDDSLVRKTIKRVRKYGRIVVYIANLDVNRMIGEKLACCGVDEREFESMKVLSFVIERSANDEQIDERRFAFLEAKRVGAAQR